MPRRSRNLSKSIICHAMSKHIFYFYDPDGSGEKGHVTAARRKLGYPLITVDTEKI